jgi:hypothetical protein
VGTHCAVAVVFHLLPVPLTVFQPLESHNVHLCFLPEEFVNQGRLGREVKLQSCSFKLRRYFSYFAPLLLWIPAFAQSGQPASSAQTAPAAPEHPKEYKLQHYVHVVPATPADYQPITAEGRLGWFVRSTVGPKSLVGGLFSAGIGTALDHPSEYGTHWVGFAQRYGMRLTGVSTGNAIEATLGSAWGEDPRYFHTRHRPVGERVKNVLDLTFRAYHPDGERHPAYARYVAIFGNNFLSNTWRVQSEADWQHAMVRTAEGFGCRILSNAFSEFVPQVWRSVRHQPEPSPPNE